MTSSKTTPTTPTVSESEWVEVGSDTGQLISWKENENHKGIYLYAKLVEFDGDTGATETATMYVFENQYGRWSTWETYQIREAMASVTEGQEVWIMCKGERKAKVGNVKIFSIKARNVTADYANQQRLAIDSEPF